MTSNWNGHPTFQHIQHDVLRAWNQMSIFYNLIGEENLNREKEYIRALPVEHRRQVVGMFEKVRDDGYDVTRAAVNRELQQGGVFNA